MNNIQPPNVEMYLAAVGRAMMDSAVTQQDLELSNRLARVGDALTRLNTIYGPTADDFTPADQQLVESYIAQENLQINS